jgi:hypothetical protein
VIDVGLDRLRLGPIEGVRRETVPGRPLEPLLETEIEQLGRHPLDEAGHVVGDVPLYCQEFPSMKCRPEKGLKPSIQRPCESLGTMYFRSG